LRHAMAHGAKADQARSDRHCVVLKAILPGCQI
jgi:hypothetical protein